MATTAKRDIHQEITDRIIAALEAGTRPWVRHWSGPAGGGLPLRVTGEPYRGVNTLILWLTAAERGYRGRHWMTFRQALALGGAVRKGEKGSAVVYYGAITKDGEPHPTTGEVADVRIPFVKTYTVFNVDQIDGLPAKFAAVDAAPAIVTTGAERVAELDAFFAATGATIVTEGNQPSYWPALDVIKMPAFETAGSAAGYYGTLAHELTHWTGAASRLDRLSKYTTTEGRAFEELVAELGACFLGATLGAPINVENSAAYIASWLKALKDDKRFIFKAAAAAQKATDFALEAAGFVAADVEPEGDEVDAPAAAPIVAAPVAAAIVAGPAQMAFAF